MAYQYIQSYAFSEVAIKRKQEAVTGDVLQKKLFLEMLQYSQENTCVGVSFL